MDQLTNEGRKRAGGDTRTPQAKALPHMSRVITHPAFILDQMGDPVRRPQTGFIPQRLRPAFESVLDLADLRRTQLKLTRP
jgi:hypothetical protein